MPLTYGDVFLQNEQEQSAYNFEHADTEMLFRHFADAEKECARMIERKLPLPAYEQCIKASHAFNLLDARGVISVTERQSYILRVRELAKACCEAWLATQKARRMRWPSCFSSCCPKRSPRACRRAPPTISSAWSATG